MTAALSVFILAVILLALGIIFLLPGADHWIKATPRNQIGGIVLTVLCMTWMGYALYFHPIDFLAFLTPTRVLIGCIILTPLICIFLNNLLCARAIGGLMMLWPMPIILLTRDYVTMWRLIPITIGYISLTCGMFIVFHPWILRIVCEHLAEQRNMRMMTALLFLLAGIFCLATITQFGKVIGQ